VYAVQSTPSDTATTCARAHDLGMRSAEIRDHGQHGGMSRLASVAAEVSLTRHQKPARARLRFVRSVVSPRHNHRSSQEERCACRIPCGTYKRARRLTPVAARHPSTNAFAPTALGTRDHTHTHICVHAPRSTTTSRGNARSKRGTLSCSRQKTAALPLRSSPASHART